MSAVGIALGALAATFAFGAAVTVPLAAGADDLPAAVQPDTEASAEVYPTPVEEPAEPAAEPAPVQEGIVEVSDCLAAVWAARDARYNGDWNRFEVLAESCEAGEVDRG